MLYTGLSIAIIVLLNYLLKTKSQSLRIKVKKWVKYTLIALFFPSTLFYLSILFSTSLEDHNDVKKGTFLWYATMDNETITEFPIIKSKEKVTYNSIGGDGPNIATGWEISYSSSENHNTLSNTIMEYLKSNGFSVSKVEKTQCYWKGRFKTSNSNQLYSGTNKKGECLDLQISKGGNIQCSIVY